MKVDLCNTSFEIKNDIPVISPENPKSNFGFSGL